MTGRASTVRPVSLAGAAVSLLLLAGFAGLGIAITGVWDLGLFVGASTFLLYRMIVVRQIVCAAHARGIALTRAGDFDRAFEEFGKSERFFRRMLNVVHKR